MKPGNPWSVKGIQPEARQAAKDAARRNGMTLGQWLNHVIMEDGPETAPQPEAPSQPLSKKEVASTIDVDDKQDLYTKIDDISSTLNKLAQQQAAPHTPAPVETIAAPAAFVTQPQQPLPISHNFPAAPAPQPAMASAWEDTRAETFSHPSNRHVSDVMTKSPDQRLGTIDSRLSALTDKLDSVAFAHTNRTPPPGQNVSDLEDGLRDIVRHIEMNDRQNTDVLKTIQSRLSELSSRTTVSSEENVQKLSYNISHLEAQLSDLTRRMSHSSDENMQQISSTIGQLDARLSNITNHLAHSSDENMEKISGTIDQLEARLLDLTHRLKNSSDENNKQVSGTLSQFDSRLSDITNRLSHSSDEKMQQVTGTIHQLDSRISELSQRLSTSSDENLQQANNIITQLDSRLTDLTQRIEHSSDENIQQLTGTIGQLDTRLSDVTQRLAKTENDADKLSYIDELERKVDGLAIQNAKNVATHSQHTDTSADLYERIKHLSAATDANNRKLEEFQSQDISGVEHKISTLASKLDETLVQQSDPQISALEERTEILASKLEDVLRDPTNSAAVEKIEKQLTDFSSRLDNTDSRFEKLSPLEDSINQLFDAFAKNQGWTKDAIANANRSTIEHMEGIAVRAVQDALENAPAGTAASTPTDGKANAAMSNSIKELHEEMKQLQAASLAASQAAEAAPHSSEGTTVPIASLQKEFDHLRETSKHTEIRNQDTLEAIHETLGKMVGRLSALEKAPAQPAPANSQASLAQAIHAETKKEETLEIDHKARFFDPKSDTSVAEPVKANAQPSGESDSSNRPEPALNHDFLAAARKAAQVAAQTPKSMPEGNGSSANEVPTEDEPSKVKFFSFAADDDKKRKMMLLTAAAVLLVIGAISATSLMSDRSVATAKSPASKKTSSVLSSAPKPALATTSKPASIKLETKKPILVQTPASNGKMSKAISTPVMEKPAETLAMVTKAVTTPQTVASTKMPVASVTTMPVAENKMPMAARETVKTARVAPATPAKARTVAPLPPSGIGPDPLRQAAATGDAKAQFEVASRYAAGKLVPQNFTTAIAWYQRAAAQGLAPAQYRLGTYYEKGRGVAKDKTSARIWYERAATNGNLKAIHNLAVIYADSSKGKPEFNKAGLWFKKAAEFGLTDSQYNLAILHERGLGVSKDTAAAYFWFQIAGKQGDKDAAARAAVLEKRMTPDQIARSKLLIKNWSPRPLDQNANEVTLPADGWQAASPASTNDVSSFTRRELVVLSQGYLIKLGFNPGPADGILGEQTRDAIREFERQQKLPVFGAVSPQMVSRLRAAAS